MKLRKTLWLAFLILPALILGACNMGGAPAPMQDAGVIQTQAMELVATQFAMQQTMTALAVPPTPLPTFTLFPSPTPGTPPTFVPIGTPGAGTPFAFNTPSTGFTPLAASALPTIGIVATMGTKNGCNDGKYLGETKPYDKDVVQAGKQFSKGWMIENTGTCTWDDGYVFAFQKDLSTPGLNGYNIVINKNDEFTKPGHSQTFIVKLKAPDAAGEYKGYWKLRDDAGNYFGPLVYVWIVVQK